MLNHGKSDSDVLILDCDLTDVNGLEAFCSQRFLPLPMG